MVEVNATNQPLSDELRLIQELEEADALEEAMQEAFTLVEKLRVPVNPTVIQRLESLIVNLIPQHAAAGDAIKNVPHMDEFLVIFHKKIEALLGTSMAMCDRDSMTLLLSALRDLQPISSLSDSLEQIVIKATRLCDRCDGVCAYLVAATKTRDPKQLASAILVARQIPGFSDPELTKAEKLFHQMRPALKSNSPNSERRVGGKKTVVESNERGLDDEASKPCFQDLPHEDVNLDSGEGDNDYESQAQHFDHSGYSDTPSSDSDEGVMKQEQSEGTSFFSVFLNPHTILLNELSDATESRDRKKIPELLVQAHWLEDSSSGPATKAASYLRRGRWKDVISGWFKEKTHFFCN